MKLRLTNATVIDRASKFHQQKTDIFIDNGIISDIGRDISDGKTIDLHGKVVTPGWVDLFAQFGEPGFEHKEDILSGSRSACMGGFTDVCLIPNTHPVIETKGDVQFLINQSKEVSLWPIAAVSEGAKGENLTEILDLQAHGAIAFGDGLNPIWNSELLLKALQYVQKFNGLVVTRPKDIGLSRYGQMHEGKVSTSLGLPGEPALAEELMVQRDLDILEYAGGRLHFSQISTAKSVKLIKRAKARGLQVTCDVSVNHLLFTDKNLGSYDTNFKLDPPLRTERDRKALLKGLNEGVIDAICTGHQPHDQECKQLEFDLADAGVIGLQTAYPALLSRFEELDFELISEKFTTGPRTVLGLGDVSINVGSQAKLAIFDPEAEWELNFSSNESKSNNSPFFGTGLKGKALGVINGEFTSF